MGVCGAMVLLVTLRANLLSKTVFPGCTINLAEDPKILQSEHYRRTFLADAPLVIYCDVFCMLRRKVNLKFSLVLQQDYIHNH